MPSATGAGPIGDEEGRDRALITLSQLTFFGGRAGRALKIAEELGQRAEHLSERHRQDLVRMLRLPLVFGSPPVEEALAALERANRVSGDSIIGEARGLGVEARLLGMAGRFDEARAQSNRARHIWAELGMTLTGLVGASGHFAETERLAGRFEDTERHLRDIHEALTETGETGSNSTICGILATTLCELGRFDEAETFAAKGRELAASNDFTSQAEWRMAQALVLAHRGEHDRALALCDEAVRITDPTDYLNDQGESHETRGRVLAGAGRTDDALAAFEGALARFERKGQPSGRSAGS